MASQQPNDPFTAAVLAPDLIARGLRLQRESEMAKQVMSQEPLQGQMISGHYVPPGLTQGLARALQQYSAYKSMEGMDKRKADLQSDTMGQYAKMFGIGGGAPQGGGSNPQALAQGLAQQGAQTMPVQPHGQMMPPQQQMQGQQPMPQQMQQQAPQQPQMPLLPGKSPQESFQAFQYLGPQQYIKLAMQQASPTDIQKNLIAQGIQPGSPQWNQALSGATQKAGYIAPISATPGAPLLDPITRQPFFSAPQNGVQTQYGPNGQASAKSVPGYSQATAGIAGDTARAQAEANAQYDTVEVLDPKTGEKVLVPRAEVANGRYVSEGSNANRVYDESQAKSYADLSDKVTTMGLDAPVKLAKLDRMEELVNDYDGGKLTGLAMDAADIANSLGIKLDPKLGDKQAAEALMNELTLQAKNAGGANSMPGSMSDADRAYLQTMSPRLAQSAEGRRQIITTLRAVTQRDALVAKMADAYRQRNNGRLDAGFTRRLAEWSAKYPMFGAK